MRKQLRIICCVGLGALLAACSSGGGDGPGISGKVTLNGGPQAGVTVNVSGAMSASATTDSGGNYTVYGVKSGSYSVNPTQTGYRFTPAARPAVMSGGSLAGYDFTAAVAPPASSVQLPQTGQVATYKPGDDGTLQKGTAWPSPRFFDNGDGTVTDKLTGLAWLKDAACIGKKSWRDALTAADGLASGICGLNDGSKGGDWRLPNVTELNSLVNAGRWNPAVGPLSTEGNPETLLFTGVGNYSYWSSTTSASLGYQAWAVHFLIGQVNPSSKKIGFNVWPVRDAGITGAVTLPRTGQTFSHAVGDDGYQQKGAAWPNPRFTDNGDGTVTDNLSKLVWLKDTNCVETSGAVVRRRANAYAVLSYSKSLVWVGGVASGACGLSDGSRKGDWRLPNRLEMQSLVDYSRLNPTLPSGHPFTNVQLQGAWTSTLLSYNQPASNGTTSWYLYTDSGITNAETNNSVGEYYFWAVRDATR